MKNRIREITEDYSNFETYRKRVRSLHEFIDYALTLKVEDAKNVILILVDPSDTHVPDEINAQMRHVIKEGSELSMLLALLMSQKRILRDLPLPERNICIQVIANELMHS